MRTIWARSFCRRRNLFLGVPTPGDVLGQNEDAFGHTGSIGETTHQNINPDLRAVFAAILPHCRPVRSARDSAEDFVNAVPEVLRMTKCSQKGVSPKHIFDRPSENAEYAIVPTGDEPAPSPVAITASRTFARNWAWRAKVSSARRRSSSGHIRTFLAATANIGYFYSAANRESHFPAADGSFRMRPWMTFLSCCVTGVDAARGPIRETCE